MWKDIFKISSVDFATLSHLFLRIGRLPQAKDPKKDMHASFDALMTIFKSHLITAACIEVGISSMDSDLSPTATVPLVSDVASKVVDRFTIISEAVLRLTVKDCNDRVHNYSRVLCHLSSLAMEFTDAWSEGDGVRVLRCWKVLLLHFFAGRRTKYALEALRIQVQLATLSPHMVHQLTWGRFVNTHGGNGRNIPCDLHNEHVNKQFKGIIRNMGANFTETASTRAARSVTTISHLVESFDSQLGIHPESSAHSRKSDEKDIKSIVTALQNQKILEVQTEPRCHSGFKTITPNPLNSLNCTKLDEWIVSKLKHFNKLTVITSPRTETCTPQESEFELDSSLDYEDECDIDFDSL